jgi:hypothetical protein
MPRPYTKTSIGLPSLNSGRGRGWGFNTVSYNTYVNYVPSATPG